MPGPIVPRPAPTPRAMALRPSVGSAPPPWASGRRSARRSMGLLVVLGGRAPEIDGSESGEDEGLKRRDKPDFEDEEDDRDRQRDDAERGEAEDDGQAAGHEEDEQVAR